MKYYKKWFAEGHITKEEANGWRDGNENDLSIAAKLGFDFNWYTTFKPNPGLITLMPHFERKVLEQMPDGFVKVLNPEGVIIMKREGAGSIPAEVDHLLKDRESWEEH